MTTPPASGPIIDLITRRLSDLTSHSIPRLRASRGPLSLQQDLAREIVGDMARVERMIEVSRADSQSIRPKRSG